MSTDSTTPTFATLLAVVRRRAPLVVICAVVGAAIAFVVSQHQHKRYTAKALILFQGQNQQLSQQAAGLPGTQPEANPQPQTDTNLQLASLPRVAAATAQVLRASLTSTDVADAVTVAQQGDTNLATVSATASSPKLAQRIANVYAQQAIAYRQQADQAYYQGTLAAVKSQYAGLSPPEKASALGADLRARAAALQILVQLRGGAVQLAQPAGLPTSPSSPRVKRNTALAGVLGLLLGFALSFGLERFDRRLREPSDLEDAFKLPLLGVVPETAALKNQASRAKSVGLSSSGPEMQLFSLLRARVRYSSPDREIRSILVVSASAGDGKSTIARNLAIAGTSAGERVLYLEADLRKPTAARSFDVPAGPGVAEMLLEHISLSDAVQGVPVHHAHEDVMLDILVAGGILPPNPTRIIESNAMARLAEEATQNYDLVVIDTPPLNVVSDAFSLLRLVDAVVIVGRVGRSTKDSAQRLRDALETAGAPVIGVVANGSAKRATERYGYAYSHEYIAREQDRVTAATRADE